MKKSNTLETVKEAYKISDYELVLFLLKDKIHNRKCSNEESILYGSSLYKSRKDIEGALNIFNKIIINRSNYIEVNHNIGYLKQQSGSIAEASVNFQKILNSKIIKNNNVLMNISENYKLMGDYKEAIDLNNRCQKINIYTEVQISLEDKVSILMRNLVLNYILDNLKESINIIKNLASQKVFINAKSTNAAYIALLAKLIKNDVNITYNGELFDVMYAIGESHAICMHNTICKYKNASYKIKSKWIEGLKAFHLGGESVNKYKTAFEIHVNNLPENSTLIVCAGEIDCRIDTGIIPAAQKMGVDPIELSKITAQKYIKYLSKFKKNGCKVIVWGIPELKIKNIEAAQMVNNVIFAFTHECQTQCDMNDIKYIDVYNLTKNKADDSDYYDRRHLKKKFIESIFNLN